MDHKRPSGGFAIIGIIAIIAVVTFASLGGWYVYRRSHNGNKSNTPVSSSTKGAVKQGPASGNTGTPQQNVDKYLDVKELGIKFKLTDPIKDAYYEVKDSAKNGKPVIALYLHSLDAYPHCAPANDPDGFASLMTFAPGAQDPVNGDFESTYPGAPLINGLRYYIAPAQYDCTGGAVNVAPMRDAFNAAYKTIVTD
ncbi:hypothetical protein [Streptomyces shenzhenensis]|uniref:hypothetical protein n=1 Tax=Streptomyces shenzhenensis TaxID=943815 RepID=UPI001F278002|nr:hypothetical protein [Streptomyces shenzhenensis]